MHHPTVELKFLVLYKVSSIAVTFFSHSIKSTDEVSSLLFSKPFEKSHVSCWKDKNEEGILTLRLVWADFCLFEDSALPQIENLTPRVEALMRCIGGTSTGVDDTIETYFN